MIDSKDAHLSLRSLSISIAVPPAPSAKAAGLGRQRPGPSRVWCWAGPAAVPGDRFLHLAVGRTVFCPSLLSESGESRPCWHFSRRVGATAAGAAAPPRRALCNMRAARRTGAGLWRAPDGCGDVVQRDRPVTCAMARFGAAALLTVTVREQHPRLHRKGAAVKVIHWMGALQFRGGRQVESF